MRAACKFIGKKFICSRTNIHVSSDRILGTLRICSQQKRDGTLGYPLKCSVRESKHHLNRIRRAARAKVTKDAGGRGGGRGRERGVATPLNCKIVSR